MDPNMTRESADKSVLLARQIMRAGNDFLIDIQRSETDEQFTAWRRKIAHILGAVCDEIYNPVFAEFPEIERALEAELGGN
jgi:hypothetical protein